MNFRIILCLGFLIVSLSECPVFAQNGADRHYDKLRKIQDEIQAVEKKIAANKKKESSQLYILTNLDLEIDLTHSIIQNLRTEQKRREKKIAGLEALLKKTTEELKHLKDVFGRRLAYLYKFGRIRDIELLLTARSVNDGLLWLEYQRRISDHDYRNFLKIKEKQEQISRNRDLLTIELEEKRKGLRDKLNKEKELKANKRKRETMLSALRNNRTLLRQQLVAKEKSAREIERLIVELESTPKTSEMLRPETLFADLKGRMLWPASGKVVTKFGTYRHPELKTVTENIGIEIKAAQGSQVRSVANGVVTAITWQRGRGNIIIVSHYGGYYSVYAHLAEIYINVMDEITMGETIGTVGESGSLKGPILHFEIWKGTEKLNPETWLAQST